MGVGDGIIRAHATRYYVWKYSLSNISISFNIL